MNPIYSRRVRRIPYNNLTQRVYKGGSLFMRRSKLPDYRWVQTALKANRRRRRQRRR